MLHLQCPEYYMYVLYIYTYIYITFKYRYGYVSIFSLSPALSVPVLLMIPTRSDIIGTLHASCVRHYQR